MRAIIKLLLACKAFLSLFAMQPLHCTILAGTCKRNVCVCVWCVCGVCVCVCVCGVCVCVCVPFVGQGRIKVRKYVMAYM